MKNVIRLLESLDLNSTNYPPTIIYNEGWMLRILLAWFSRNREIEYRFRFHANAKWFSEGQLATPFNSRFRGDKLGETRTNADGIIGQFRIESTSRTGIQLLADATQFIVIEAKLFSKLSSRTKNIRGYDQAARNVACMAEVLKKTGIDPINKISLGFYLLAPKSQISANSFPEMTYDSINEKVKRRVDSYEGERDDWYKEWFLPMMNHIDISMISWEECIEVIDSIDKKFSSSYKEFYAICLAQNRVAEITPDRN